MDPAVICAQNGVANERFALRRFRRVYGMCVWLSATHVAPGEVAGVSYGGGSSWQSLTRGTGWIEADFLNGEIALLGREHGIPAPVNEALQRLANQAAADRLPPGSVTPEETLAAAEA